jgi:hypothetical protein
MEEFNTKPNNGRIHALPLQNTNVMILEVVSGDSDEDR